MTLCKTGLVTKHPSPLCCRYFPPLGIQKTGFSFWSYSTKVVNRPEGFRSLTTQFLQEYFIPQSFCKGWTTPRFHVTCTTDQGPLNRQIYNILKALPPQHCHPWTVTHHRRKTRHSLASETIWAGMQDCASKSRKCCIQNRGKISLGHFQCIRWHLNKKSDLKDFTYRDTTSSGSLLATIPSEWWVSYLTLHTES